MEFQKLIFNIIGCTIILTIIQIRKPFRGFKDWFFNVIAVSLAVILIKIST